MITLSDNVRYRLRVLSRVIAAAIGGYALASAIAVLLALIWPLPRAEAVLISSMVSFVWYAVAVIWVFSTRSATRAWIGMVLPTLVIALICWWLDAGAFREAGHLAQGECYLRRPSRRAAE